MLSILAIRPSLVVIWSQSGRHIRLTVTLAVAAATVSAAVSIAVSLIWVSSYGIQGRSRVHDTA